jgi:mRNA interferase RelE/StbE
MPPTKPYSIELRQSAAKELSALPAPARWRVRAAIETLAESPRPRGVVKLRGREDQLRIRVGSYRVVFEVDDRRRVVTIGRIRNRKDAYR